MKTLALPAVLLLGAMIPLEGAGAGDPQRGPPNLKGPVVGSDTPAAKRDLIGWYGTWEGARAEAARSERPILLLSAAPQCHNISGLW